MVAYTSLPDNKNRIYGGAYSVHDKELVDCRDRLIKQFVELDSSDTNIAETIKKEFVETYKTWLFSDFNFVGADLYQHVCFTQGTTESFAQFYIRYRINRRLRLSRGEYFYHQMMKSLWYDNQFAWLDEDQIQAGDVVLLSVPFSDTGDLPVDLNKILDQCDQLNVPVMLDFAYLNLTVKSVFDYEIDLSRPCIKYIVSSLSKAFPVENMRIGIRLQKELYEDQIYVINETNYNYINLLSAYVGTGLMKSYTPNYMFHKYRSKQLELCEQLDLIPSPCYIFGIDYKNKYSEYNRGNNTNRLCFSRIWDDRCTKQNLKI